MDPSKQLRRKKIFTFIIALIFGLALGAAGFVVYKQYILKTPDGLPSLISRKTPKPETTRNPLDGTEVEKSVANRHPLAIIIENHPEARPQAGLDKASIIYEAITEGGITRYLAVYGPRDADKVGPVRSLRTFFLDWACEYEAFLAHVGGNIDALDRIPVESVLDLDQFRYGDRAYWREPERGKAIEHTMYTSTPKLYQIAEKNNWDMKGNFESFHFLNSPSYQSEPGLNQKITIDFSSPSYKVSYEYNPTTNNYLRFLAGYPHKDALTGNQLAPTNLIIQSVERHPGLTRINEDSWTFETIGEGKAKIFYGGQEIEATWKKPDLKARTKFYDSSGEEIKFLPGQFWYEIVPPEVFEKIKIENTQS